MFYRKNLPGWERAMRVIAGLVLIGWGFLGSPVLPPVFAMATGAAVILTGFFGFCPMCAMVGRKLPSA